MFVCRQCGHIEERAGFCNQDGSRLEPSEDALVGVTVGSYRLTRLIGRGGMGVVYQGVQPDIGSRVAVKVLAGEMIESAKAVQRFFDEARSVNLIRHENIVNVLDLAPLPDGRPYMVMEFLDGQTLRAAMSSQRLPFALAISVLGEILDALSAAHQQGIVHRDLKPENVFVTPGGHAKVLDFGIAKLRPDLTGDRPPTRSGVVLGTPHYMSPEQALGASIDARTDVYSLGIILYEVLTGTRPFDAPTLFGLIQMHLRERPAPLSSRRPGVPREFEEVALVALEKDPARRFPSAAAMKDALFAAYSRSGLGVGVFGPAACQAVPLAPDLGARGPSAPVLSPPVASPYPQAQAVSPPHALPPTVVGVDATAHTPSFATGQSAPSPAFVAGGAPARRGSGLRGLPLVAIIGCGGLLVLGAMAGAGYLWWLASNEVAMEAGRLARAVATAESPNQPEATKWRPTLAAGGLTRAAVDLKAFDPSAFLPRAQTLAVQHYSDAQLTSFFVEGLAPTGLVDLTASDDFEVMYSFRSPSQSVPGPNHPTNLEYEGPCVVSVYIDRDGVRVLPGTWKCTDRFVPRPNCRPKQIWSEAISLGAPSGNVVGMLRYAADGDSKDPRWAVSIPPNFSGLLPDQC